MNSKMLHNDIENHNSFMITPLDVRSMKKRKIKIKSNEKKGFVIVDHESKS